MNRELKFRAWNKLWGMSRPHSVWELIYLDMPKDDHVEIMQFTGIIDKKGNEIYEGDVVTIKVGDEAEVSQVWWNTDHAKFVISNYSGLGFDEYKPSQVEVIGNIHENPELIDRN